MLIRMQRTTINPFFENAGGSINFYPDKSGAAPTAEMYHRETSEFSVQDVKAFCKKHGITENVFFISAFGITLGKYNFRKDAVFTTIYHGRNDSRLSDTVGMLVKTLPFTVISQEHCGLPECCPAAAD